jgi:hypothetical protein
MKEFIHILLTRYDEISSDPSRVELFNKYTLDSIKKQSIHNFLWVFISSTDVNVNFENKKIFSSEEYSLWKKELFNEYEYIIETPLNEEDYLNPNFIESIQTNFYRRNYSLEFRGYRYDARINQMYEDTFYNKDRISPFVTTISSTKDEKDRTEEIYFPTLYKEQRMWVQIISEHKLNKLTDNDSIDVISKKGKRCSSPWWFDTK